MKIGKLKQKKPEGRDTFDIRNESVQKIVDYMESILEKEDILKCELDRIQTMAGNDNGETS